MGRTLIVMPSIPAALDGSRFWLDRKAVDGMALYASLWPGPVRCLMRAGDRAAIPFGDSFAPGDLPFEFRIAPARPHEEPALFDDAALVLASGDSHLDFGVERAVAAPTVFIIENTLGTRLRMVRLNDGRSLKAVKSAVWTVKTEVARRRAFARAAGLQCNGAPAFHAYRSLTPRPLLYFDTRTGDARQIGPEALAAKQAAIRVGKPLRIAFSGRLEPIKGVDHLVPVAAELARAGVAFTLDVYGGGSLFDAMGAQASAAGLADRVVLHGPVPFDEELMPAMVDRTDLFLCCHRQADPSCTYLETLSCGVPIVGYDNAAFRGVLGLGEVGVATPMDRPAAAARAVAALDRDRPRLADMMAAAAAAGRANSFERVFAARIAHLRSIAGV